jgi:hypothetical protein
VIVVPSSFTTIELGPTGPPNPVFPFPLNVTCPKFVKLKSNKIKEKSSFVFIIIWINLLEDKYLKTHF